VLRDTGASLHNGIEPPTRGFSIRVFSEQLFDIYNYIYDLKVIGTLLGTLILRVFMRQIACGHAVSRDFVQPAKDRIGIVG
jgi:hypothetical protein